MAEAMKRLNGEVPALVTGVVILSLVVVVFFFSMVISLTPPTGQAIIPIPNSVMGVIGMLIVFFVVLYFVYNETRK